MKNKQSLMEGLALALAGVLLLAGAALAQNQGKNPGVCPVGQASQVCTGGPGGTCTIQQPNQQNCPRAGKGQKRQMRGSQGGGQANQPTTSDNPPATSK